MTISHSNYLAEQSVNLRSESFESTGFTVQFPTDTCWEIFQKRNHVLIGLSPGNSYFSPEERISRMAHWARSEFQSMHFFTWETPFTWTLQAIGYPENKARAKAHDNAQRVKNKAYRSLLSVGFTDPDSRILTWSKLQKIPAYQRTRENVQELFQSDPLFREYCLDLVREYLAGQQLRGTMSFEDRVAIGVRYYLEEIPLFINTPGIVDVDSSTYCYHQFSWFHQQLYQRLLPIRPVTGQARAILVDNRALDNRSRHETQS